MSGPSGNVMQVAHELTTDVCHEPGTSPSGGAAAAESHHEAPSVFTWTSCQQGAKDWGPCCWSLSAGTDVEHTSNISLVLVLCFLFFFKWLCRNSYWTRGAAIERIPFKLWLFVNPPALFICQHEVSLSVCPQCDLASHDTRDSLWHALIRRKSIGWERKQATHSCWSCEKNCLTGGVQIQGAGSGRWMKRLQSLQSDGAAARQSAGRVDLMLWRHAASGFAGGFGKLPLWKVGQRQTHVRQWGGAAASAGGRSRNNNNNNTDGWFLLFLWQTGCLPHWTDHNDWWVFSSWQY